jgi:hypothetical protein
METLKATKKAVLKPLSLGKLKTDLNIIMAEIDRCSGILPDYYSPVMWQRLQETADKVAGAIQSVRMKLTNPEMTCEEIGLKLGLGKMSVAGYLAWNSMLAPDWVKPAEVIASTPCPKCGVPAGSRCDYCSAPAHKIHKERRAAYKASPLGVMYLKDRAAEMEARYGLTLVAAAS